MDEDIRVVFVSTMSLWNILILIWNCQYSHEFHFSFQTIRKYSKLNRNRNCQFNKNVIISIAKN